MIARALRTHGEEILDREGASERGLRILDDLDRFNRRVGWYRTHVRNVRRHWEALGRPRPFRVLDVGTGPGGLLDALADWARRDGVPVELTGIDRSPAFVAMARARLGERATVLVGDATDLPSPDRAWDLATSTLMLHHLPGPVRTKMVRELGRVARSAYLFDLELSVHGMVGWPLIALGMGMSRDALHDGVLSVRRASTLAEFATLVAPLPVRVVRVLPTALCTLPRG